MFKKIILTLFLILGITFWYGYNNMEDELIAKNLSNNVLRFHVVGNSDSISDQSVKLKVKENVVKYIKKNSTNFTSKKDAAQFVYSHKPTIENIAKNTLKKYNFDYSVSSYLGYKDFPVKTYGDITFPKGNYFSYNIYLGKGKGHNFWCVLYPSLCFVDASTSTVPDSSKEKLKSSLTHNQYKRITKFRFKFLTFLNP